MKAASTKEVILGMDNGQLHEIAVDEKDKREKYIKFLFELSELPEAFTGLQVSFCMLQWNLFHSPFTVRCASWCPLLTIGMFMPLLSDLCLTSRDYIMRFCLI